jgi:putative membrane-bound dehydrogenase-like protein
MLRTRRLPVNLLFAISLLAGPLVAAEPAPSAVASGPFSPAEAVNRFQLHPDCRIELVAAEPDVLDPVHIAFDVEARLWVVEYSDYPNGPAAGQPGLSRIRVLTDADADGRYDQPVLFADRLLFATGLLPWRDGVIVTTAGHVLFLRDTDGDGRADERQEWFAGFKEENPQLRANHPTLAIDNHVYIASGLRGGDVRPGKDWAAAFGRDPANVPAPVSLSGRDFRFDPLTGDFEAVTGPGQFGLTFDDWGRRFVCDNRHPCKHIVFEESDLRLNPQVSVAQTFADVLPAGEESRLYPISRTWTTSNLHANQFTAACGLHIARGNALPAAMQGQPFVCDPTANLVHHARMEPLGATFTSKPDREGVEFLATTDEWFRPVNLTTGPDGALYVVDMYRAVIEHPQFMPDELKTRPDLLLGMDKGRIYRIVAKDAHPQPPVRCLPLPPSNLIEAAIDLLKHPNGWQRDLGHHQLLESPSPDAVDSLKLMTLIEDTSPEARAHALWLLARKTTPHVPSVLSALADADPRVQEQALRIVMNAPILNVEIARAVSELAKNRENPRLQFVATLALATTIGPSDDTPLLAAAAVDCAADSWRAAAIRLATRHPERHAERVFEIVAKLRRWESPGAWSDRASRLALIQTTSEVAARQQSDADALRAISQCSQLAPEAGPLGAARIAGIGRGLQYRRSSLDAVTADASTEVVEYLTELWWWSKRNVKGEGDQDTALAVALQEFVKWTRADLLLDVADRHRDTAVRRQAIEVLGRRREPEIDDWLVRNLAGMAPELRQSRIAAAFATSNRISLLLDEMESGRLSPRLIDPARVKQLTTHKNVAIRERAEKLFAALTPAERKAVLAQYQPCLELAAEPARGREVFKAQCSTCHKIGDLGVNVAPDISDSRVKTREYLLTSILDPNQAIDNNYFSYTLIDVDGLVHTGILATETGTSVTLKQPEGKTITLPRDQIEQLKSNGISLMPEGLERNITPQQMADLISFIKNWRYLDGSVPPEVIR